MKYKFLSLGLLLVLLLIALVSGVFQASSSKTPVQQLKHITGVQMFSGPVLPDVSFTDQAGDVRLIKGLQGKWTLLFFGYTYCPDVCPTTLLTLGQVWKTLSPEQQTALNVVFVSVDPERDTPATLQPYMQYFNSSFIALTGNPESLQRLSAAVSAFYAKAQAHEDNLGYLMNHSANIILIDPVGRYRGFIEPPFENQRLEKIIPLLLSVPALVTVPALTNSQ